MPRARKHLVCVDDTPYYHVTSRCVRRAFLCGTDGFSGRSYEHRRQWIEDRVRILASLFSIEVCAYAIMSNHYHLVVRLNPEEAASWSEDDVLERWSALFRGPLLVQRYRAGEPLSAAELHTLRSTTAVFRQRLSSLSWFMKCLNEPVARMANREDRCTGHFWEARFHSQALRSERALIAAMAYVDLNPVRAGIANRPEQSEYTSLRARLNVRQQRTRLAAGISEAIQRGELLHFQPPMRPLMRFSDAGGQPNTTTLPVRESEYFKLVDIAGRAKARGKRGRIDPALAPVLERLCLSVDQWLEASSAFRRLYRAGDLRKAG